MLLYLPVLIQGDIITSIKDTGRYNNINKGLSVAIAGICLKDSYHVHYAAGCTPQR
jgi:hypothetical protein